MPANYSSEQRDDTVRLMGLFAPMRWRGTLLKKIKHSDEECIADFTNHFYLTYDHCLQKFYVLFDGIFGVVKDCLLPEKSFINSEMTDFTTFIDHTLSVLNVCNSRRFQMPRSWSKWSEMLDNELDRCEEKKTLAKLKKRYKQVEEYEFDEAIKQVGLSKGTP